MRISLPLESNLWNNNLRFMHILIIEDEKGIVDFLQQGLEEEGYIISTAANGEEGLIKALELSVD